MLSLTKTASHLLCAATLSLACFMLSCWGPLAVNAARLCPSFAYPNATAQISLPKSGSVVNGYVIGNNYVAAAIYYDQAGNSWGYVVSYPLQGFGSAPAWITPAFEEDVIELIGPIASPAYWVPLQFGKHLAFVNALTGAVSKAEQPPSLDYASSTMCVVGNHFYIMQQDSPSSPGVTLYAFDLSSAHPKASSQPLFRCKGDPFACFGESRMSCSQSPDGKTDLVAVAYSSFLSVYEAQWADPQLKSFLPLGNYSFSPNTMTFGLQTIPYNGDDILIVSANFLDDSVIPTVLGFQVKDPSKGPLWSLKPAFHAENAAISTEPSTGKLLITSTEQAAPRWTAMYLVDPLTGRSLWNVTFPPVNGADAVLIPFNDCAPPSPYIPVLFVGDRVLVTFVDPITGTQAGAYELPEALISDYTSGSIDAHTTYAGVIVSGDSTVCVRPYSSMYVAPPYVAA